MACGEITATSDDGGGGGGGFDQSLVTVDQCGFQENDVVPSDPVTAFADIKNGNDSSADALVRLSVSPGTHSENLDVLVPGGGTERVTTTFVPGDVGIEDATVSLDVTFVDVAESTATIAGYR